MSDFVQNLAARGAGLPVSLPVEPAAVAPAPDVFGPAAHEATREVLAAPSVVHEAEAAPRAPETRPDEPDELQTQPESLPDVGAAEEQVPLPEVPRRVEVAVVDLAPAPLDQPGVALTGHTDEPTSPRDGGQVAEEIESERDVRTRVVAETMPTEEVVVPPSPEVVPAEPETEPDIHALLDEAEDVQDAHLPQPPPLPLEPRTEQQVNSMSAPPARTHREPLPPTAAHADSSEPAPTVEPASRRDSASVEAPMQTVAAPPRVIEEAAKRRRAVRAENEPPAAQTVRPQVPPVRAKRPVAPIEPATASIPAVLEHTPSEAASTLVAADSSTTTLPVVRNIETVPAAVSRPVAAFPALDARPASVPPRIDVRIGAVEVRGAEPPPATEPPPPAPAAQGFDEYLAVRSYQR